MPRLPRIIIPGVPVHLLNRGHNRAAIFHDLLDYRFFLALVRGAATANRVAMHAYSLMRNHYHLTATPSDVEGAVAMMERIGGDYSRYYNKKYERSGTIWGRRYTSRLIESAEYFLTCLRYVELNPVRAGIVETPDQYRWSSYRAHAYGEWPEWLTPHPAYLALGDTTERRQQQYRAFCGAVDDSDLTFLMAWDDGCLARAWPGPGTGQAPREA